ncbi:hypothetical protein SAMN04489712_117116 [Thermomonospora echinospora]|uniref:Uncharacterized protein n=1 Tax=Thermomonospora echinospora TaxID=1992 RepID=A0A1H6DII5_9ACTN|nr:hypothetical protein SAMN04489712_117116 [Thermomonospora echinospora]
MALGGEVMPVTGSRRRSARAMPRHPRASGPLRRRRLAIRARSAFSARAERIPLGLGRPRATALRAAGAIT